MAQTPTQRRANEKFAKREELKRGKPESAIKAKKEKFKSPISPLWLGILGFVVFGGLLFEVIRLIFRTYL
ncbi:hypothetical protein EV426DRAFT_604127 [Tirmania nivea]|nr:hypothetical protein EV426DRAFT_604127 [Tirmania nivea]